MRFRVLITDGISPEGLAPLEREAEVVQSDDITALGEFDAVIVRSRTKLTASVIETGLPRLRVIGRAGVGVDNIDLVTANQHGIVVVNTPDAPTIAAAELTLGLMLALARMIPQADASLRRGEWRKSDLVGIELYGKTLGILGVGRIGSALAERAGVMGMKILGHDPLVEAQSILERGAKPTEYRELLQSSDFISVHVPLTKNTYGLIDETAFGMMKRGARLISTSRGGVVDEHALLENLNNGHLAGAALDVFAKEPSDHKALLQHPKMISTPHIGAQTEEARIRTSAKITKEVLAALKQETLHWQVN